MEINNRQRAIEYVRSKMAAAKLNPTRLARAAGVDAGTVYDFLKGERWPQTDSQGAIEIALNLPAGSIDRIGRGVPSDADITHMGEGRATVGAEGQDSPTKGRLFVDDEVAAFVRIASQMTEAMPLLKAFTASMDAMAIEMQALAKSVNARVQSDAPPP